LCLCALKIAKLMLSDEEILKLYRDKNFSGSYSGVRTFQVLLKTQLNVDVPLKRLYDILKTDPIYLMHLQPIKHFPRRKYVVRNVGELCQMGT